MLHTDIGCTENVLGYYRLNMPFLGKGRDLDDVLGDGVLILAFSLLYVFG